MSLDFRHVADSQNLDGVLSHWAAMPDKTRDGEPFEGYYTNVGLKDEFRCLIAALYGRRLSKHGSANASDVTARCQFYGKGALGSVRR
jgi:hypothetical protein